MTCVTDTVIPLIMEGGVYIIKIIIESTTVGYFVIQYRPMLHVHVYAVQTCIM